MKSNISYWADISMDSKLGQCVIIRKRSRVARSILGEGVCVSSHINISESIIADEVNIMEKCVIVNCQIGRNVKIRTHNQLTNVSIGDYSYTSHNTKIQYTTIGKFCSVGPDVKIGLGIHPTNFISTHPIFYSNQEACAKKLRDNSCFIEHKAIQIGNDVWIGANAIIADGVKIGDGAIIAAGAMVNSDVPGYAIVGGVPAKLIRMRFGEDVIASISNSGWWNKEIEWLRKNNDLFIREDLASIDIEARFK